MAKNGQLNANQRKAISALLQYSTAREAAQAIGVGESTMYHYLADENFRAELEAHQRRIVEATMSRLVGLSSLALQTMQELLEDEATPPATKARVAIAMLEHIKGLADRQSGVSDEKPILRVVWSTPSDPPVETNFTD